MQRKPFVLVVDDEPGIRRGLRWSLEQLQYEVEEAADGLAALEAARSFRPDVVLMDVVMPDTGGLEACFLMKADPELAEIPVLFLSAAADLTTKAAGFELGAQDYILKTTDIREIDLRLKAAIAAKRRQERLLETTRCMAREKETLTEAAQTDPLTGLFNRRTLEERGRRMVEHCMAGGEPVSLIMADVDHFKQVNDRLGHATGDQVLRAVAQHLKSSLREVDLCLRIGGEEFAMILPGAPAEVGLRVAERLRRGVAVLALPRTASVTISMGVACAPGDGRSLDDLLAAADSRLYAAKAAGRNCAIGA